MRDNKWWLRGTRLVTRSSLTRLIPRGDYINAPPLLPLDPYLESGAVHNPGAYHVDDGNEDWQFGQDDYQNTAGTAPPADQPTDDAWDWGADNGPLDDTMEIEATAQTSHLDPGDLPATDQLDLFSTEDGYDDPLVDLTEASVGPVQPNAPPFDAPPDDSWAWDDFDADDWWHGGDQAQDPSDLARQDDWPWETEPDDDHQTIVDDDDDVVGPDQPGLIADDWDWTETPEADDWWQALDAPPPDAVVAQDAPVEDAWVWTEDDPQEEFLTEEMPQVSFAHLPFQDEWVEPELEADDWWPQEGAQDPSEIPVDDAWPWQQDETVEAFEPDEYTQSADPTPDDVWPWTDDADDPLPDDQAPQDAVVSAPLPIDDGWVWDAEVPPDVVPTGYMQAELLPRQEGDSVDWDWSEDGGHLFDWTDDYPSVNLVASGPLTPEDPWHWESDAVEDEWVDFIERVGPNGATGADRSVLGNPRLQNLLRRRDDFDISPTNDYDWAWLPIVDDDTWWHDTEFYNSNAGAALPALGPDDAWDWFGDITDEFPEDIATLGPNKPIDPNVAGIASLQNLLRRRDDFETQPVQSDDWDWYQLDPQEELPLESGPVVGAQVTFLEYPVEDGFDHFPPEPDNDWVEPSEVVGADANAPLPRSSEEHEWQHWNDGEGDYEIEPSQPVDAPSQPAPEEWNWDEDGIEDDWWHAGTADFKPNDFVPIAGPQAIDDAWDFAADSTDDTWWERLPQPDTDGTTGPDLCPILLAQAYARIAELEAELAECLKHHGDGDGNHGGSGDGDDIDHGHHGRQRARDRNEDDEQRRILDKNEAEKRARIDRNNALIMAIVAATVHGLKGPKGPK